MITHNIFNDIFVIPILNLLVLFHAAFNAIHLPGALGFAIITLTVLVRLILHPFFKQQIHTARKMQEIKPHLDKLQEKHKKDPKKLQEEQLKLYKEHGLNPAAGCLFLIIQIPVFIGLYTTLNILLRNGTDKKILASINKMLYIPSLQIHNVNPWFFGFDLVLSPQKSGLWYYYLIPAITAVLQYWQAAVSTAPVPNSSDKKEVVSKKSEEKKADNAADFQKAMNTQMKYIFPLMIGWFSFSLPVGLSLYWNIFSIFSIIQYKRTHQLI